VEAERDLLLRGILRSHEKKIAQGKYLS